MSEWSFQPYDPEMVTRSSLPRKIFVRTAPVVAAFTFSALVALRLAGGLAEQAINAAPGQMAAPLPLPELRRQVADAEAAQPLPAPAQIEARAAPKTSMRQAASAQTRNPYGALFDPEGSLVGVPALMAENAPIGPAFSPLQSQPLFVLADPVEPGEQVAEAETAPPAERQEAQAAPQNTRQIALQSTPPSTPLVLPPPRPDLEAKPPQQLAELEVADAPVPPARPSELSTQPRAVETVAPRAVEPSAPREVQTALPRVPENATPRRAASRASARGGAPTLAQGEQGNVFEKIFGGLQATGQQLAYAAQEGAALRLSSGATSSPSPVTTSGGTAVYDIAAHTVYLPSGERLEAHSGLGPYFDDPDHVHLRMRGATPPAVYELKLRESLFHGVQALRLNPVSGTTHGRNGLLAHTFMLGARGDSNGCVSFRNYRAFLQAYMNGEVRRLVVVARR
ncbi:tlde1 domain-containing protein [uncultured Rhodoblastus sp.]|uniref:tlde1 domain-containing protein n=1 Tax=uncultured Rhodoblastus sp. TaxID=543037 RepID=UPI0025E8D9F0|nr:tlde1 domain-containing protein [uncultured Rhodoblastus sp.]